MRAGQAFFVKLLPILADKHSSEERSLINLKVPAICPRTCMSNEPVLRITTWNLAKGPLSPEISSHLVMQLTDAKGPFILPRPITQPAIITSVPELLDWRVRNHHVESPPSFQEEQQLFSLSNAFLIINAQKWLSPLASQVITAAVHLCDGHIFVSNKYQFRLSDETLKRHHLGDGTSLFYHLLYGEIQTLGTSPMDIIKEIAKYPPPPTESELEYLISPKPLKHFPGSFDYPGLIGVGDSNIRMERKADNGKFEYAWAIYSGFMYGIGQIYCITDDTSLFDTIRVLHYMYKQLFEGSFW